LLERRNRGCEGKGEEPEARIQESENYVSSTVRTSSGFAASALDLLAPGFWILAPDSTPGTTSA